MTENKRTGCNGKMPSNFTGRSITDALEATEDGDSLLRLQVP